MEKRRSKRFPIALAVEITHLDGKRVSRAVQTTNISSGGLLFSTAREMTPGRMTEYLTTLVGSDPPVRIRCRGVVLRVRKLEEAGEPRFEVAVTIDRYEFLRPSPFPSPAENAAAPAVSG